MHTYISAEGLKKLKDELDCLKNVKRKEVIERIAKAKELGDLSENAEYSDAKDEQGFIEGRIMELEKIINDVVVVKESSKNSDFVNIGSEIKVKIDSEIKKFKIVGSREANPGENKISNESPLGQALLGRKVGEKVRVIIPKGEIEYQILEIN
ncbi:transcription elongation factor GreA [Candidatus Parcubacteria bacterium]|nr:MAG: transcription elongation factor GreA [Candidatus Parcubacteria bacterium]